MRLQLGMAGTPRFLAAPALLAFVAASVSVVLTREARGIEILWFANAALLALVLRHRREHWPVLFLSGGVAGLIANLASGDAPATAALLSLCNLLEVLTGALLVRRFDERAEHLATVRGLGLFILLAGGLAPALSAFPASAILWGLEGADPMMAAKRWFLAGALGTMTLGPLLLTLRARELAAMLRLDAAVHVTSTIASALVITGAVFAQSRYPLLFVIPPSLILAAFRLRFAGAAVAALGVAIVASVATIHGSGPIAMTVPTFAERILFLQFFILVCVGTALFAAAVLAERARLFIDERRSGEALAESERLHHLLANNSSDMIVRIGLDGVRRYVSPACRRVLGYEPEQMVGGAPVGAIHAEDRARVMAVCRTLLTGADNPICTYRQQHRDGHYVWLEASYRLVRDERGEPAEFIASVRDVGRRLAVELEATETSARLQESNRLFTMAGELAQIGHWRVDLVRQEVMWSDEVCRLHGVEPGCAPTLESAIDFYHPDDREMVASLVAQAIEKGVGFKFTARLLRFDGEMRHVTSRGQAERAPDGSIIGIFGVIQDISEHVAAEAAVRSSERMHRVLAEASSDIIVRFALDGTPLYVSPACSMVLGFEPDEMMVRGAVRDIHPDDRANVLAAWSEVVRGGSVEACLYRQRRRDGGEVWLEAAYRLARADTTGGEAEVVATVRDVTRRRLAELASAEATARVREANLLLVEARERAEAAADSKANFLATMSHEIRTPMTGVLGMIELLRSDADPGQRDRFFDTLEQSARTLMTVLDDILDFSKIEAGNLTLEVLDFDLAALAHSVGDLFGNAASAKGLTLCVRTPAASIPVRGDPTRIRQILSNLVSNAIKFTEAGNVSLEISPGAPGRWRIEVADTGIGIDPDVSAKLFSPFVQADASTTRRFGGTGLGLSISQRLASAMRGELGVVPRAGGGSVFWLELPLEVAASPEGLASNEPNGDPDAATPPLRVLVAEDNEVNQLLLTGLLRRLGHEPVCVANGALAVAEVERGYDVVLMDMQMPVMDGVAATRAIRDLGSRAATIPIIALTADALPERRRFYENIGLSGFLTKPVDVALLTAALRGIAGAAAPTLDASRDPVAIDPRRLAELRTMLGEETISTLLALIVSEAAQRPDAIHALLSAGDLTAAGGMAHGLRGAASNVGALGLADAAKAIEQAPDLAAATRELPKLRLAASAVIASCAPTSSPTPIAEGR